jgi:hypothetical protein
MDRSFLFLLLYSMAVQLLSISLTLLKSHLSDVTEVSVSNMLSIRWLWTYKWYCVAVVLIAVPWLICTFMTAQMAKELSQGTHTAVVAVLGGALTASILGFLQYFVYQILRAEALPPFGFNRVWVNIGLMACLSVATSLLAFDTIQRLGLS